MSALPPSVRAVLVAGAVKRAITSAQLADPAAVCVVYERGVPLPDDVRAVDAAVASVGAVTQQRAADIATGRGCIEYARTLADAPEAGTRHVLFVGTEHRTAIVPWPAPTRAPGAPTRGAA